MFIMGALHLILGLQTGMANSATRRLHLLAAAAGILNFITFGALIFTQQAHAELLTLISLILVCIPNLQLLRVNDRSALISRVIGGSDIITSVTIWIVLTK